MERLTKNDLNKVCYDPWEICGMDKHCTKGCHDEGGCTKGCHILKIYRKLADYEDTGLSPTMVLDTIKARDMAQKQALENAHIVDDYRQAEEQGLLLRLPCPIGTTVFNTTWWDNVEERVKVNGKTFCRIAHEHKVSKSKFSYMDIEQFGKTVFLTREEAEAKLAEMQKG